MNVGEVKPFYEDYVKMVNGFRSNFAENEKMLEVNKINIKEKIISSLFKGS